jgi:predicted AAA+ superfamily ATPase
MQDSHINISRCLLEARFTRSFEKEFITVLTGQRQIGKTTFIKNFLKDKQIEHPLYINLDVLSQREKLSNEGLKRSIENFYNASLPELMDHKRRRVIFIDEAQKLPEIFEEIKVIFDEYRHLHKIKFILTGSSVLDLYSKSAESLAGRVDLIKGYCFSLHELGQMHGIKTARQNFLKIFTPDSSLEELCTLQEGFCPSNDNDSQELIEKALLKGLLPEVIKLYKQSKYHKNVIEYAGSHKETYIEKDIRGLKKVDETRIFSKFFDIITSQAGNILVKSNISRELELNYDTLERFLSYVYSTFVIYLPRPFLPSAHKRIIKNPKIYIFDNLFLSYTHGFQNVDQLEKSGLIGIYFENLVFNELKKLLQNEYPYLEICFYRTSNDAEIDFILDYKKKIIPIEVKWADSSKSLRLSVLKRFIREENCDYGIVIYNGSFNIDKENKIVFFPAQYFMKSLKELQESGQ